ncbi:11134_t:CDS:1, partial [Ambispora gerdemannii]
AVQEIDNSPEIQVANATILPQVVREHLEKITVIQDNVNNQLEKSCKYMIKHSSVHHRTNVLEPGQLVAIAPDTDMNPSTRKRKLEVIFKDTGMIIGMTNNNKTIIIETSEENTKHCPSKRVHHLKKVDS